LGGAFYCGEATSFAHFHFSFDWSKKIAEMIAHFLGDSVCHVAP